MTQRKKTRFERHVEQLAHTEAAVLLLTLRIQQAQRTANGEYVWLDDTQAQTGAQLSVN